MKTSKIKLNRDEKEILYFYDSSEWQSVENRDQEITRYRQYARSGLKRR